METFFSADTASLRKFWGNIRWVNRLPLISEDNKDNNYHDNNKDIIILIIKEQKSPQHNNNENATEERYHRNHFQNYFFPVAER